jgi:tRNA dimethylallyltransferase
MKTKLVIILGPTAVGKSELAMELAALLSGEIVSADSQQVYRYLDIGTGKPSPEDQQRIPHHLIDILDPDEPFNVALFRTLAAQRIEQIHQRGRAVLVCGGSGLYIKALTQGLFEGPAHDPAIRRILQQRIDQDGLAALYEQLVEIDPNVISTIDANDRQRTIRALEVYQLTGRPLSQWQKDHAFQQQPYDVLKIGLNRERSELYERINRRCEQMIQDGLLDEVRGLVAMGFGLALKPLRSVGYRQMGQALSGVQELPDAIAEMKQETRKLAKRQLTWFRADHEICWFDPDSKAAITDAVKAFLFS